MSVADDLELLDDLQHSAAEIAAEAAELSRGQIDRRMFLFFSLVGAAASKFGFGDSPRTPASAAGGLAQQPTLSSLGNSEPLSWTFEPYPGGTGALMEKLIAERGADAFRRSPFVVEQWNGSLPTSDEDVAFLPAHRLSALIRQRKLTSARLTRIYLERIKRLDPVLRCAVTVMETHALAEAARADAELRAGKYRGPLHGIPYGIKDLFSAKDAPTTWGAREFEHRIIDEDAEVVVRLREAGAVLMAKLATAKFAFGAAWFGGPTMNPWDVRTPAGGSSGGPASATAAGCVGFSIGTETSGSLVSPAMLCGLSALRPTFGRVSRHGAMTYAWSADRVGVMCRTVEDCAMVFNAIHGADPKDPSTVTTPFHFDRNVKLSSMRIGFDADSPQEFVQLLRDFGAQMTPIGPRVVSATPVSNAEAAAAFDSYVQSKATELGVDLTATLESAGAQRGGIATVAATDSRAAALMRAVDGMVWMINGRLQRAFELIQDQRRRLMMIRHMAELLADVDMYVPRESAPRSWDIAVHALTGHPAAVIPYKVASPGSVPSRTQRSDSTSDRTSPEPRVPANAQPICAIIAGNLYHDDVLLSAAHQVERQINLPRSHPQT
jgi:Asp-tRNA(Asn)/Glu-tRNA(Gln) amidotransferase A subunit family amidase